MRIRKAGIFTAIFLVLASLVWLAGCSGTPSETPTEGGVMVTAKDTNGAPLEGVLVTSESQPEGQEKLNGLTGSDGVVLFEGLKPGDYAISISKENYSGTVVTINVIAGSPIQMDASMPSIPASQ